MALKSHTKPRVLFILKKQDHSVYTNSQYVSSPGLKISTQFIVDELIELGYVAKMVEVVDNNSIDKEVTTFQPTHVVIEALWVVPTKFDVLAKLHPTVKWIVQIHSKLSFLSHEGVGVEWLMDYLNHENVSVSFNSEAMKDTFLDLYAIHGTKATKRVFFLPNFYPTDFTNVWKAPLDVLNVGCFGATRPLKNQLIQAVAAVQYAANQRYVLQYHINSSRVEQQGGAVLKNIRSLFAALPADQYSLIEHQWMPHPDFVKLVSTMHVVLQVSLSETFNIVTADAVSRGVPVVTSSEVSWVNPRFQANPANADDIVKKIGLAIRYGWLHNIYNSNQGGLADASHLAVSQWKDMLKS